MESKRPIGGSPVLEMVENKTDLVIRNAGLELYNLYLKSQLYQLQDSISEGTGVTKLHEQLISMRDEVDRKSEEIMKLKSALANQIHKLKLLNDKPRTDESLNENRELRIEEEPGLEMDDKPDHYQIDKEIKMKNKEHQQQKMLSSNIKHDPDKIEVRLQNEIQRLTQENRQLMDKNVVLNDMVKKQDEKLKLILNKLDEMGIKFADEKDPSNLRISRVKLTVMKNQRERLGMFEIQDGLEKEVMKRLVTDLKPRTALTLLPVLPAYIIFMCIRHADYTNNEEKVGFILSTFVKCVRKTIRKRHDDIETKALWLSNILRLVNNMKQYSGEEEFQKKNTPQQNEKSLIHFDLTEYRTVISDLTLWIYYELLHDLARKIHPLILPGIVEYEEMSSIKCSKSDINHNKDLCRNLTAYYKLLQIYGIDKDIISQVFTQLFHFICASSLNNLLVRNELCNWMKGFQIRHNISNLEMWTRENNLHENAITMTLQPIIQACQLLQARKSDDDVDSICEICTALTPLQICQILSLYTPKDEYEKITPTSVIRNVQEKLQARNGIQDQALMMNVNHRFPVRIFYTPSSICLEDIEIPEILNLPMIKKI